MYLDHVLVFSYNETVNVNKKNWFTVIKIVIEENLKISLSECNLNVCNLEFFSFNVCTEEILHSDKKVNELRSFFMPKRF